ncbi:MAG: YdcF family protein [Sphingomonadales bacterium]|nr:YdcF family protein [Sphingomonadales bacterium]
MIYLHKILPLLVMPISITIFLILLGVIRKKMGYIGFAILFLYGCSMPYMADLFFGWVEKSGERVSAVTLKKADAIVVLSGMLHTVPGRDSLFTEWSDPDRFFAGLECFRQKKAPLLIFTRGQMPWSTGEPEGEVLAREAIAMGVPSQAVLLTDSVENTADEAKAVEKLLKRNQQRIILVTSAFHMTRSKRLFQENGFLVQPYAVDYKVGADKNTFIDFLPTAEALRKTEWGIRELLGRLYYLVR